ncbi:multifunctional cytochrome P450 monooxygenase af510 [Colletotrichum liriopes]|uniref:Multifunctional cytochrome P450 monooxygenase af510 n=1 Tax=Colletotrichum liriopes TaxID=708192 RepID=A0AA37LW19_9PEZI|nr:multifunctional cytochrome P450 monooxygenase af510 [Colletotrichum liriopes]
MKDSTLVVGLVVALLAIYIVDKIIQARKDARRFPLPPGPRGLPIVQNMFDLPKKDTFAAPQFAKFKDKYGPLTALRVIGKPFIIINDSQVALDILEKKSAEFSSRPSLTFIGEMYAVAMNRISLCSLPSNFRVGWVKATGGIPYNHTFRLHRKVFARIIGTKTTASQFDELQEAEVGHFLLHVLDSPENLKEHIHKQVNIVAEAGTVALKIAYGYNADQFNKDPLLSRMNKVMDDFAQSAVLGRYLVDFFPALKYLPDWFPGTTWKRLARQYRAEFHDAVERPYRFVESQMAEGRENLSYLAKAMATSENTPEEIHNNMWTAGSIFSGGADTSVASVNAFFLAMAKFPEAQKRAQEEIDRVIGSDRLPTISDRDSLPYLEALIKEVLRWHPIAPMGLLHMSSEEATYLNYRLPKGSLVLCNIWWFMNNPEVYKEPSRFRPERFLEGEGREPEPDPRRYVFGFGRRICPGRVLADNSLYLNFAQSLAVFIIGKPIVDGKEVEPEFRPLPGAISHVAPYEATIKPRSPRHEQLIRSIEQRFPWQQSDAKGLEAV